MRRATINDVAQIAGVSKSTVSRVLNGRGLPLITPETVERIRRVAAELDYRPSLFARGLTTKRSQLIGVLVRGLTTSFWMPVMAEFQRTCGERGYHVVLGRNDARDTEADQGRVLHQIGVDGIVTLGDYPGDEDVLRMLAVARPLVGVCRTFPGDAIPCVVAGNAEGIRAALDHLFSHGHRRVGFLTRNYSTHDGRARLDAFVSYHGEHDLPYDDRLIQRVVVGHVADGVQAFVDLPNRPTAILSHDDLFAMQTMAALRGMGLRVPDDVSVVGFGDFDFATSLNPSLTTVRMPLEAMGRRAAIRLIDRIEGRKDGDQCEVFPTELVVRESSARALGVLDPRP